MATLPHWLAFIVAKNRAHGFPVVRDSAHGFPVSCLSGTKCSTAVKEWLPHTWQGPWLQQIRVFDNCTVLSGYKAPSLTQNSVSTIFLGLAWPGKGPRLTNGRFCPSNNVYSSLETAGELYTTVFQYNRFPVSCVFLLLSTGILRLFPCGQLSCRRFPSVFCTLVPLFPLETHWNQILLFFNVASSSIFSWPQ